MLTTLRMPMVGQAVERETQATILKLYSYTQFGGGDIMVEVSTPAACGPQKFDLGLWGGQFP